jgi:tetratricopeptide (TPR) repeat protein
VSARLLEPLLALALALLAAAPVSGAFDSPEVAGGPDADGSAAPTLTGFADEPLASRRERAAALVRLGEADAVPAVVAILDAGEPDHEVRRALVDFLARVDLGDARAEERAGTLARVARSDPRPDVATYTIAALETMRHAAAGAALDELVDALPAPFRTDAARALARTAYGREAIMRRVRGAASGEEPVPADVLGALVATSGRVLADRLVGGASASDVAPFVALMRHPDGRVRVAARVGLENLIVRGTQLLDVERSEDVLDALQVAGWDPRMLDYRRALDALRLTDDPARALLPARRLAEWGVARDDRGARMHRFYGLYLEAVAMAASGRADRAGPRLDEAGAILAALLRERYDLRPDFTEPSDRRRLEAVDYARHAVLIELMRVTAMLLAGEPPDGARALTGFENAHARLIEAQIMAESWGVDLPCDLDAILDHELGPRRLLYENATNPKLTREEGIVLMTSIGRGFASVARTEMPGFEPYDGVSQLRQNPLKDDRRFQLLLRLHEEQRNRGFRESLDPDLSNRERLQRRFRADTADRKLRDASRDAQAGSARWDAFEFLLRLRDPSQLALWLARDLRAEGRAQETRDLAERMLTDLEESGLAWDGLEAEIGLAIASSYTEESRPEEAEAVLLGVLSNLEATGNQYADARDTAREEGDDAREAMWEVWTRRNELRIADCLVSLAVNANVRMGQPEKAVGYFERAFELNQSDFMRALLACYRARSGRFEEARAELREVAVAPGLYYNMACTYALMGEPALALDFLQREFEESVQSRGALERQKAWARDDPDLESLRELERFRRLTSAE